MPSFATNGPIYKVNNVVIPAQPTSCTYTLNDVSAEDAGRTQDGLMHKNRIGQAVTLQLSWANVDTATAHAILSMFQPEYLSVNYFDLKSNAYVTKVFYVGDRSAPIYNSKLGLWSNISFNIIQRGVV